LLMTVLTPNALSDTSSSAEMKPLSMRIGRFGRIPFISRARASPGTRGIARSVMMRSQPSGFSRNAASASNGSAKASTE